MTRANIYQLTFKDQTLKPGEIVRSFCAVLGHNLKDQSIKAMTHPDNPASSLLLCTEADADALNARATELGIKPLDLDKDRMDRRERASKPFKAQLG